MYNKSFYLFSFLLVLFLVFAACAKTEVELYGNLHGIVTDAESNEPIQGASITLNPGGKSTTTGSDGRYEFNDLNPGQYTVQVQKAMYNSNSKSVTVEPGITAKGDIVISSGTGTLQVSQGLLNFSSSDNLLSFEIHNNGQNSLTWEVKEDCDWISVSPTSGTTKKGNISTVSVSISREGLAVNTNHTYTLNVTSNGGSAEVKVTIVNKAELQSSPTALNFEIDRSEDYIQLTNATGIGALNYSLTTSQPWLTVSKNSGSVSASGESLLVSVDRTGLKTGTYQGQINIKTTTANNLIIPVTLKVDNGSSGSELVVPVGLLGYYTFDDETGDDLSEYERHGIVSSARYITDTPNRKGKALSITESDQTFVVPSNPFKKLKSFSFSFWIKDFSDGTIMVANANGYLNSSVPHFYMEKGILTCKIYPSYNSTPFSYSTDQMLDGKWHHVTVTSSEATEALYVDGRLVSSIRGSYDPVGSATEIIFGGSPIERMISSNEKIDNVRFYNRVISAEDVKTIYNAEKQ